MAELQVPPPWSPELVIEPAANVTLWTVLFAQVQVTVAPPMTLMAGGSKARPEVMDTEVVADASKLLSIESRILMGGATSGVMPPQLPGADGAVNVRVILRCRPLFDAIGRRAFEAGPEPESAAAIKITNNFVLGCAIEVMGEGFALTRGYGVAPSVFYDVLTDGMFNCTAYKVYGDIIAQEDYDRVGITATLGLKDANLALTAGEAKNVPLPSGNAWRDRLIGAIAHGDGDKDWAVVGLEQARASGLE